MGESTMILPTLASASLLLLTAATPDTELDTMRARLSHQQRSAAVQPYITRATECVARSVAADPRSSDATKLGDLIVDSMPSCAELMRSMIDTYDQYFGDGTGEAFFSGPYLDVLPTAVSKRVTRGQR
jgi:hypothetical protein